MVSKSILIVFVASAFMLFINMNCNKGIRPPQTQADGLPLETQEGKNTFGCFWNDTLWLPVSQPFSGSALDAVYYKDLGYFQISASNQTNLENISIVSFNENEGIYYIDSTCEVRLNIKKKYRGYNKSFKLQITKFDKAQPSKSGVISGKFSAILYRLYSFGTGIKDSFDLKDSIKITKGVFDAQLR